MRLFATIAAFALAQDDSECGADMLEYEGFCMDKTQENMEMIQEFISLNLDGGLERTKKAISASYDASCENQLRFNGR